MLDLNDVDQPDDLLDLLAAAEANAETDFEIVFCRDMRQRFDRCGSRLRLTSAQAHKLRCIAHAGGFWERGAWGG